MHCDLSVIYPLHDHANHPSIERECQENFPNSSKMNNLIEHILLLFQQRVQIIFLFLEMQVLVASLSFQDRTIDRVQEIIVFLIKTSPIHTYQYDLVYLISILNKPYTSRHEREDMLFAARRQYEE